MKTMKEDRCYDAPMLGKKFWKKVAGVFLILIGILALITPFTPGAWLAFIGLELLGIRLLAWDRAKDWFLKRRSKVEEESTDQAT